MDWLKTVELYDLAWYNSLIHIFIGYELQTNHINYP